MLYARTPDNEPIEPAPGLRALCPDCHEPVLAKCGAINVWHWAHERGDDCDTWSEAESKWHRAWKAHWPMRLVEVSMQRDGVRHRADIVGRAGVVLELQHSSITPVEIAAREAFYGRMVWVFDARDVWDGDRFLPRNRGSHITFRWKQPRKHIAACKQMVVLDFGFDRLFHLKQLYIGPPTGGWGYSLDRNDFIRRLGGQV
ncbi:MAG TPA: competence protein CoiA family protein [Roseiflexaceae bacterium]|nr:competence protein CoiA family protein [Roseiflexaceae bacterium]